MSDVNVVKLRNAFGGLCAWLAGTTVANAAAFGPLHVPSPDWRDQVIYFAMTDRFDDGDPRNNDQGAGEYDPKDGSRYSGGDLQGLQRRLDYIQGLGATALWITPPVAQQWLDRPANFSGYHGYWAEHFGRVDRHLGTLADYRRLSRALHGRGMYLVQDIVVNHTADFFHYGPGWSAADPARDWRPKEGAAPRTRPSQPPFDQIDPRDPKQRRAAVYHWTPDIADYNDERQRLTFQMGGLDDLNTENPVVRRALRRSYGDWIRRAGVDAFRVDTAFYVPPGFFADFLHARDPRAPGISEVARRTGRRDFLTFGEGFGIDPPGQDAQMRRIEGYVTDPRGRPLMSGMLNFPLYGTLGDVFARGRPPAELAWRIGRVMALHAQPHRMPSFVDNHDVDRFLAGGSTAALRQALLALFTLPGIPVIYYGTEQGFTEQRASMFAAGWGSGGRDHFDRGAPLYRLIAAMSALRRSHPVLSRGRPELLAGEEAGQGALAWAMRQDGATALVAFNTADRATLLDRMPTGLPPGTPLRGVFGLDGMPPDLTVDADGRVSLPLPARAGWVWRPATAREAAPAERTAAPAAAMTIDGGDVQAGVTGDLALSGQAPGAAALQLVVDGDLARAQTVPVAADGRWQASVSTAEMIDSAARHRVVAWDAARAVASTPRHFRVSLPWSVVADVDDPPGDDRGPEGRYRYPTDPGWGDNRQADLRRIAVATAGGAMRLDIGLHRLTRLWNPPNGFDHVALTVFIELPGQPGGATVMPLQNASLPAGMRWHRRVRVNGWTNGLFDARGADAGHEGTAIAPVPSLSVDAATATVRLVLPPSALGGLSSLSGARVYVTTWDYDGGYRALADQPGPFTFGGGRPDAPRVMDDSDVITVP